jgi:hypothetical protein
MFYRSSRAVLSSRAPIPCQSETLFSLCITCVLTSGQCCHTTDEDRALTGMWVIDKVRLSVQEEYRILKIHEVYEYKVTRFDHETRECDLFAGYIDTFLKLKAESSGYPARVRTPTDEERYIESS